MKLEEEAKRFKMKQRNISGTTGERTALRFYAGQALSGLLPGNRPDEIIHQAWEYAYKMSEKEKLEFDSLKENKKEGE